MRLSKEKNNELLQSVRLEMVQNSSITIFELQDALETKYGRQFDKNFIAKLKNKIHRERALRISKSIGYALATLEDTDNELCRRLWEIVDKEHSSAFETISAIRAIWAISNSLLDTKFNSGIFEQQTGVVKEEKPLSEEQRKVIEKVWAYALTPELPKKMM